jgi:ATP-dependent phosphofructokinase / diphosphate-dependent phosphofructokinase
VVKEKVKGNWNMKRLLVVTGGGDCPGLNAVIRAIVKRSQLSKDWEVFGSVCSFTGIFSEPPQLKVLDTNAVRGIHVLGGTILQTTNRGNPINWKEEGPDGKIVQRDRGQELVDRVRNLGFDAIISIGGDGSQTISYELHKLGCPVVGVPKTIDNDLSGTDFTFGFHTAVQITTECVDRLVTTAESHNRVMIVEVMGRDAGWIALHTAVAGGAEVCLIPEIPYDINKVAERIKGRFVDGKGFAIVVVAEGAKSKEGTVTTQQHVEVGREHVRLGGVAYHLSDQLRSIGLKAEIREVVIGHLQRGGTPVAFDRVIATQFGVKAFELVEQGDFGKMVSYRCPKIVSIPLADAIKVYRTIDPSDPLLETAKGLSICMG